MDIASSLAIMLEFASPLLVFRNQLLNPQRITVSPVLDGRINALNEYSQSYQHARLMVVSNKNIFGISHFP